MGELVNRREERPGARGAGSGPEALAGADQAGEAGAVSYTHLRAHETGLDIVWRLLLEKKKKTKKTKKTNTTQKIKQNVTLTTNTLIR